MSEYIEMSYKSIECFANDGKLDVAELQALLALAEKDGVVDEDEKRVLINIFGRLNQAELTESMQEKISAIRTQYNF